MSERLSHLFYIATRNPKLKILGAGTLSAAILLASATPEGTPMPKRIMIGSQDPNTQEQLREHGTTVFAGPYTNSAPLAFAQLGVTFNVETIVVSRMDETKYYQVELPDKSTKNLTLNLGIQGTEIFPEHGFIQESNVMQAPAK